MTDLTSPQMGEFFQQGDYWLHGAGKQLNAGDSDGSTGLGSTTPPYRWNRSDHPYSGPDNWTRNSASTVPVFPTFGMSSTDLALAQSDFAAYARSRITGVGAAQYSQDSKQAFEDLTVSQLVDEAVDELADILNYTVMLAVQLGRLKARLEAAQ